jgi:hypothetical protein
MLSEGIHYFGLLLSSVLQMRISCRKHQGVCVSALPARSFNEAISIWLSSGEWGFMYAMVRRRVTITEELGPISHPGVKAGQVANNKRAGVD